MKEQTLQGSLTFLGFAISVIAVIYFAFEFLDEVSEWTRLAALVLLGLFFAFLGVYLKSTVVGEPFFASPRLQWLRAPYVLYVMALIAGIAAEIVFLGIDDLDRALKVLISLVVGVALIVGVAMRRKAEPSQG